MLGHRRVRAAGDRGLPRRPVRQAARAAPGRSSRSAARCGAREARSSTTGQLYTIPLPAGAGHRARQAAQDHHPPRAAPTSRSGSPSLGDEERRDDRRAGRRLAAALLPAGEGAGGVGRRARRRPRQARRRAGPAADHRRRARRASARTSRRAPRPRPPDVRALRRRHGRPRASNFYNDLVAATATRRRPDEIQDLYLDGKKDEAAAAGARRLPRAASRCRPRGLREGAHRGATRRPA